MDKPVLGSAFDGRCRFRAIYTAIRADHGRKLPDDQPVEHALRYFPDEQLDASSSIPVYLGPERLALHVVIIPGFVADCVGALLKPFQFAQIHLEKHGFKATLVPVAGRRGSSDNAKQIATALTGVLHSPDEKLVFIGYSKGINDVLQAVVDYPEIRFRTAAVVSLAGAVGGSPLAEQMSPRLAHLFDRLPLPGCARGNGEAIAGLTRAARRKWLRENALPDAVSYFSIVAAPQRRRVSRLLRPGYRRLKGQGWLNDGQVVYHDAIIPNSTLLAYVNADHWAVTLPIARQWPRLAALAVEQNAFPREVLLEATVRYVEEYLISKR